MTAPDSDLPPLDLTHLEDLAERVARAAAGALGTAAKDGQPRNWGQPVGQGHGDVTFLLDQATERAVDGWLADQAREGPLSLFTEDAGWRHRGPAPGAPEGSVALPDFDHGGPRLIVDPVDGTRHLMFDLRSAWCVIGMAGPGPAQPRLADLQHGLLAELPDTRAQQARRLAASRGAGAQSWTVSTSSAASQATDPGSPAGQDPQADSPRRALQADGDPRPDHGYFPFYAYHPDMRPAVQTLGNAFLQRLQEHEGAQIAHCYDDQYIASGGQLALLALGAYRMVCDPRPLVAARRGAPTQSAKPYDLAGAVLVAREAGCVVLDLAGEQLDVPLDGHTEVGFCAFHNRVSAERFLPHLLATLEQ